MNNVTIDNLRKTIDAIFAGETAEDVSHCIINALQIERLFGNMSNKNSARRVLFALCRQYDIQVKDTELFRVENK